MKWTVLSDNRSCNHSLVTELDLSKLPIGARRGIVMIDPEIVVEQIVVNPDNNYYSYFGN